jgi:hypothetical protein
MKIPEMKVPCWNLYCSELAVLETKGNYYQIYCPGCETVSLASRNVYESLDNWYEVFNDKSRNKTHVIILEEKPL